MVRDPLASSKMNSNCSLASLNSTLGLMNVLRILGVNNLGSGSLITFQLLNRHLWLITLVMDSPDLGQGSPILTWVHTHHWAIWFKSRSGVELKNLHF